MARTRDITSFMKVVRRASMSANIADIKLHQFSSLQRDLAPGIPMVRIKGIIHPHYNKSAGKRSLFYPGRTNHSK
jgi:hypothetical protein